MSKIIEEMLEETKKMYSAQVALRCLKGKKLTYEEIAECCDLTVEEVKELAKDYNLMPV